MLIIMETPIDITNEQPVAKNSLQDIGKKISGFFSSLMQKKTETGSATIVLTRKQAMTTVSIGLISFVAMLGYGYFTYLKHVEINGRAPELINLNQYGINVNGDLLNSYASDIVTLNELLTVGEDVSAKLASRRQLAIDQGQYYDLFLRNIYLPRLNIWKNPYTAVIDPTIIGQNYLEMNQFQDLHLIQYWSEFFRNVGDGAEYNEVSEIRVGDITDVSAEHFVIPIDVSFIAPNKRSFLLLVNKLSTTSNANNISSLNEFFFYLIKNIKENMQEEIQVLRDEYAPLFPHVEGALDEDTVIGYHLYQWAKRDGENILINDEVLKTTIKENILCDDARQESECFYAFREKYRDLPHLAYTIGMINETGITEHFESFLNELSPIITIKSFNFEKIQNSNFLSSAAQTYQGQVSFNVYGRGIPSAEVEEIAKEL